jgi:hypothetical protein
MTDRRRQDEIGRRLREAYDSIVQEELPQEMIDILCKVGLRLELEQNADVVAKPGPGARDEPDESAPADAPRPRPKRPLLSTAAQLEWDGLLANPVSERPPGPRLALAPAVRRRQGELGRRLREMYDNVIREEPPEELIELLGEAWLSEELKKPPGERQLLSPEDFKPAQDRAAPERDGGPVSPEPPDSET